MEWSTILLGMPGLYELIFIFIVVLLVFGASRLPNIGKFLGKGMREFKKAIKETQSNEDDTKQAEDKTS